MCFNNQHLENELKHLKKVFRDINGYPNRIIEQTIEPLKNINQMPQSTQVTTNNGKNRTFANVTVEK